MCAAIAPNDTKAHTWPVVLDLGAASGSGSSSRASTSGTSTPNSDLVSIRLNFKPPTAPSARSTAGLLHAPNASASTAPWVMEVTQGGEAGEEQSSKAFVYSGEQTGAKELDCVLIWDEGKQAYVLSQLGTCFSLRHDRSRTTLSPAASRVIANPPPLPPTTRPKRQSTLSASALGAGSALAPPAAASAPADLSERPAAPVRRASKSQSKRSVAAREAESLAARGRARAQADAEFAAEQEARREAEKEAVLLERQTHEQITMARRRARAEQEQQRQEAQMDLDQPPSPPREASRAAMEQAAEPARTAEARDERMEEPSPPAAPVESPAQGLGLRTSSSHSPAPPASTPHITSSALPSVSNSSVGPPMSAGAGTSWRPPPRPREAAEVVFDDEEEEESDEESGEGEEEELDDADLEDFAAELEAQFG